MIQKKRKTPCIADSVLFRFLRQIFNYKPVEQCSSYEAAVSMLEENSVIPEGFKESILVADRFNIRQEIWSMKPKSAFVQTILECMDESMCGYLLMVDSTLPGKDGLFLVAAATEDAYGSDMGYHIAQWNRESVAPVSAITGSMTFDNNEYLSITALQLSSFVPHEYRV